MNTAHALNRITAHAIYASYNSPLYDSAAMDGIAVNSANTRVESETRPLELKAGEDYIVVDTGGHIRRTFDAVIGSAADVELSRPFSELDKTVVSIGPCKTAMHILGLRICRTRKPANTTYRISGGFSEIPKRRSLRALGKRRGLSCQSIA